MEILTLLKANIKHKRGAFKSILVLMMIVSMSLTAVISVNDNIYRNLDEALIHADTGDFASYISDAQLTKPIREALEQSKEVERIKDVPFLSAMKYTINGKTTANNAMALMTWTGQYPVFNAKNTDFLPNPAELNAGEIYAPLCFQTLYGCEIGGKVVVSTTSSEEVLTVKGFIEEPFNGAYVIGIKQVFLSSADYERLASTRLDDISDLDPRLMAYHLLHVFQAEDSSLSLAAFKNTVNKESGLINHSFVILTRADAVGYTTLITDIGAGILYVFIVLLLAIVLIVMGHSISTGIEMDYVNLGVLKSQGFTKGKIRKVFVLQYLIAQGAGVLAGVLLAIPLTIWMGKAFQPITGILATPDISLLKCGLLILGILVLGASFVLAMTAKIGKISPVRAISGGRETIYFDSRLNVPIGRKFLSARLALRPFTAGKRAYIGTILIVAILVFFMMSMTILARCMDTNSIAESLGGIQSDVEVTLNKDFDMGKAADIEKDISSITGVTSALYAEGRYLSLDGTDYICTAFDDPQKFKSISKGRAPLYSNEIIITEIVRDEIGKGIGDTVTVSYQDSQEEYLISGFYQSTSDVGRCFGMSLEGMKRLEGIWVSGGFFDLEDSSKAQEVADRLNEKYSAVLTATVPDDSDARVEMTEFLLNMVAGVIYGVSALFALVVVNMVCGKAFLKERQDIGIYKAMGFTASNLRLQFAIRFFVLSLIGSAVGIALCVLLNEKLLSGLLRATGITNFKTEYNLFTFAAPVTLVCVCFFVFAYAASGKIRSVAIKELVVE